MQKLPDYYKILSVSPDADSDEIKRAFKEKALLYHPDVNQSDKAVEVFQLINAAYHTLINPEFRRKYDFMMKYGQPPEAGNIDIRRRHPADANYYYRHQRNQNHSNPPQTPKTTKAIRNLNLFIFYSITAILTVGIFFGMIDLFVNFRIGGLLFSIVALIVIISGVHIIRKEKNEK
jgi:curved DNA-binding protein CbpA